MRFIATDQKLRREVALKVLPPEMASSPERLDRFRREAKALAALDHPGIVSVFSVEEAESPQPERSAERSGAESRSEKPWGWGLAAP